MGGVFHSIGGRVSALSGVAKMAAMGEELDGELLSLLEDEVEHLADLLEASRVLPRRESETGVCRIAFEVPRIVALVERCHEARSLEIRYQGPDSGAHATIDRTMFTHGLSCLLLCLCWRAHELQATGIELSLDHSEGSVTLRGRVFGAGECDVHADQSPPNLPPPYVITAGLDCLRNDLSTVGGSLTTEGLGIPDRFELGLATP